MKNKKIYIFGHRNPDTDSVTSAIALSHLKNELGMNTIPTVLSGVVPPSISFNISIICFISNCRSIYRIFEYQKRVL